MSAKHLVSERRDEPLERVSDEHELVVASDGRSGELRGTGEVGRLEVEAEHGVDAGAVGGGDVPSGGVAGQLEQHPQPARACHLQSHTEPALAAMRPVRPHRAAKFRGPPNS